MTTQIAEPFAPRFMEAAELNDLLLRSQLKQGADLKVLMYYATAVPMGEPVRSTATDIGRMVGLSTTSASRSIGRLAENGWLQLAYSAVGVKFYRLGAKASGLPPAPGAPDDDADAPLATVRRVGTAGDNAAVESFFALLQKNVLDRRAWATRQELRIAIVTWIERTYHRRRRQKRLARLTPVEYETIMTPPAALAA